VTNKLVRDHGGPTWDPERDHAWFAGFAPADDPQLAVVVLIEHGGHGGQAAAPVAMEVFKGWFEVVAPQAAGADKAAAPKPEGAK
jgi:penicillin-binding protein 2